MIIELGRLTKHLPRMRGLNALRSFYRAVLPAGKTFRIRDFDGDLQLDVDLREGIGVNLWHNPAGYERAERELFCSAITAGCNVLDVGANVGIYTLLAAKRGANVFAIEADPVNAARLRQHLKLNGLEQRVTIFEMAASANAQALTLYRNPKNCGATSVYGDGESFVTQAAPIDALSLPPIDVCKMDIEGAEVAALLGMSQTFERSPGMRLLVECSDEHRETGDFLRIVRERFGRISVVGGEALVGHPPRFCNLWCAN
jgi:FkbM family methyltransferase